MTINAPAVHGWVSCRCHPAPAIALPLSHSRPACQQSLIRGRPTEIPRLRFCGPAASRARPACADGASPACSQFTNTHGAERAYALLADNITPGYLVRATEALVVLAVIVDANEADRGSSYVGPMGIARCQLPWASAALGLSSLLASSSLGVAWTSGVLWASPGHLLGVPWALLGVSFPGCLPGVS